MQVSLDASYHPPAHDLPAAAHPTQQDAGCKDKDADVAAPASKRPKTAACTLDVVEDGGVRELEALHSELEESGACSQSTLKMACVRELEKEERKAVYHILSRRFPAWTPAGYETSEDKVREGAKEKEQERESKRERARERARERWREKDKEKEEANRAKSEKQR